MNYTLRNLIVAALLMLLGIVAVTSFIRGERKELSRGKQEVQVFVASKDIPSGTPAKELKEGGFIEIQGMLREDRPPNAVGELATISKFVSNETIYKGEVIPLTAFDNTAGLAPTNQIKGNERLYAVPIPSANNAAGLIRQGDHVDISAALGGGGSGGVTAIIARDVEVMETPDSLTPEGVEVEAAAPEAEGDTKLYVFKTTDEEWMDIKFALANADDDGLMLALRPSNGDAESKIDPIYPATLPPKGPIIDSQFGPNPSVR